jgi:hypothetical protein
MNRREFLAGALASPLLPAWHAHAQSPIYTADMHFHSFFADSKYNARPLAQKLAAGNTTLAAWSLVGDLLWFDVETYKQYVKLTFARGAALDDPSDLFNSSLEGNVRRAIDIHEGDKINEKALKALIRAAVALNTSARATARPVRSRKKPKRA